MPDPSQILLAEATRLLASTRRRIDLTLALLEQTPAPPELTRRRLRAGQIQPLEQRHHQLRAGGLDPGVDAELQPRR